MSLKGERIPSVAGSAQELKEGDAEDEAPLYRITFKPNGPAVYGPLDPSVAVLLQRLLDTLDRTDDSRLPFLELRRLSDPLIETSTTPLRQFIGTEYWHHFLNPTLQPLLLTDGAAELLEQSGCEGLFLEIAARMLEFGGRDPFVAAQLEGDGTVRYSDGHKTQYPGSHSGPRLSGPLTLYCAHDAGLEAHVLMLSSEY